MLGRHPNNDFLITYHFQAVLIKQDAPQEETGAFGNRWTRHGVGIGVAAITDEHDGQATMGAS